jgi:Protein of unknown function (DUF1214)
MTDPGHRSQWQTTVAWRELLDGIGELEQEFLNGPRGVGADEQAVAEGYRFLATATGIAFDHYLFPERTNPTFVDINTPTRRDRAWGGDNTDAYYCFAPIDPDRCYRLWGSRGDSVYYSVTVYNEPTPGAWSDRIVAIVRDTDIVLDADGNFEFVIGPTRPSGYLGMFVAAGGDASVVFTRDYQLDPVTGRRATWNIEPLEPPDPISHTDIDTAERLRTALRWMRVMFAIVPMGVGVRADDPTTLGHNSPQLANEFAEPYQVPDANFGWSARDACYGFGSFIIEPDEALVVTHTPPTCRFWNLTVWNQFMAGHSILDERTSINHAMAQPNSDGTVTIVIATTLLDHPNAVSTVNHRAGVAAFRWFLPDAIPARPTVALVKIADAPTTLT